MLRGMQWDDSWPTQEGRKKEEEAGDQRRWKAGPTAGERANQSNTGGPN